MASRLHGGLRWAAAAAALLLAAPIAAEEPFARGTIHAGLAGGWAAGFEPGSQDQDDVRAAFLIPSIGIGLTDPLGGEAWYRGNFDLSLEPQAIARLDEDGYAAGAALLVRYHFLARPRVVPFLSAGVGLVGLEFDGRFQDDGFNFIVQGGGGAHLFWRARTALTVEARWHHISNANLRSPNRGIDSALGLLGVTHFFD